MNRANPRKKKRYLVWGAVLVVVLVAGAYANSLPRRLRWQDHAEVVFHHPALDVVRTGELDNASLSTLSPDALFLGEGRFVYRGDRQNSYSGPERPLFRPPAGSMGGRLREMVASSRLVRHFRRLAAPTNAAILRTGTLLVMYDRMYRSTDGGDTFATVDSLPEAAGIPDMYGLSEATPRNDVYYGELIFREEEHAVRIYKGSNDGRTWEVKHTFPPGVTGHVHSIVFDPYRDRLWICTGDSPQESKLFFTDDDFRTVHILGQGDPGWRIVGLIVTKDALFWGSDGEPEGSNIYRYDFGTGERKKVQHVGNPVWFGAQLADGTMVLSSSYEPFITYTAERSPPKEAALWFSRDGTVWYKAVTFGYRPEVHVGLNAVLGLTRSNSRRGELYVSPYGPLEKSLTVQRYEVRWNTPKPALPL